MGVRQNRGHKMSYMTGNQTMKQHLREYRGKAQSPQLLSVARKHVRWSKGIPQNLVGYLQGWMVPEVQAVSGAPPTGQIGVGKRATLELLSPEWSVPARTPGMPSDMLGSRGASTNATN